MQFYLQLLAQCVALIGVQHKLVYYAIYLNK